MMLFFLLVVDTRPSEVSQMFLHRTIIIAKKWKMLISAENCSMFFILFYNIAKCFLFALNRYYFLISGCLCYFLATMVHGSIFCCCENKQNFLGNLLRYTFMNYL